MELTMCEYCLFTHSIVVTATSRGTSVVAATWKTPPKPPPPLTGAPSSSTSPLPIPRSFFLLLLRAEFWYEESKKL